MMKYNMFQHKSRVIYSSGEDEPEMEWVFTIFLLFEFSWIPSYYERAKLQTASTYKSTCRIVDTDSDEDEETR